MKMKLLLLSTLVAVLPGLSACTTRTATLEITCDLFQEDQYFTWEVDVSPGDSVVVTLCSNPTTGFQWAESAQISDQTVLKQTDHEYEPAEDESIVGGAGKDSRHSMKVRLPYQWNTADPGKTARRDTGHLRRLSPLNRMHNQHGCCV